jgi:polyphenol oxidase
MITFNASQHIFSSSLLNTDSIVSGFGTKTLGDSRSIHTAISYFQKQKIQYKALVIPHQIHSVNIAVVDSSHILGAGNIVHLPDVDGLITKEKDVMLTIETADCVPIMFADRVNHIVAISHQGWRGSLKKMAVKMVEKMLEIGAKKEQIQVAIGPCIGMCCYSVHEDRYAEFMFEFEDYDDTIFVYHGGKHYLNLARLNYLQLVDYGIKKDHVDFFPFCTSCDKNRFYSYRRDTKQTFGEMLSFVMCI